MRNRLPYLFFLPFAIAIQWFSVHAQSMSPGAIVKLDPSLDQILAPDAKLELLAGEGSFEGGEGPLWMERGESGYLLFSDVSGNRIMQWTPDCFKFPCSTDGKLSVFLEHSGYRDASRVGGVDASGAHLYGSNGLTLDREGRILLDATGDRAVERLENNGKRTTLADHFEEKRLTCPNDIVVKSDGAVYFTDGAAGCLAKKEDDPAKERHFTGFTWFEMEICKSWTRIPGDFRRTAWRFPRTKKFSMSIMEARDQIRDRFLPMTCKQTVPSKISGSLLILPARKARAVPMA
jgi:hypothetical protein